MIDWVKYQGWGGSVYGVKEFREQFYNAMKQKGPRLIEVMIERNIRIK